MRDPNTAAATLLGPAAGLAGGLLAFAAGTTPWLAPCAALAAAAIAYAARALTGATPAQHAGAATAAIVAVVAIAAAAPPTAAGWLAIAAIGWAIAELARADRPPAIALIPALAAATLEPAAVALIAIAGIRIRARTAWRIAAPIAGALAIVLALAAGAADTGVLARLGATWFGGAPHPTEVAAALARLGDALGPLIAVAALAGMATALAARVDLARLALATCALGGLLVDARAGAPGATAIALAALGAGIAVGRLAAMLRIASGQVVVAATLGFVLALPPAWIALAAAR